MQLSPGKGYCMGRGPEKGWETRLETPGSHITLSLPHGPTRPKQDSICYLLKKETLKPYIALGSFWKILYLGPFC